MLKSILTVANVQKLSKEQKETINGAASSNECCTAIYGTLICAPGRRIGNGSCLWY